MTKGCSFKEQFFIRSLILIVIDLEHDHDADGKSLTGFIGNAQAGCWVRLSHFAFAPKNPTYQTCAYVEAL